MTLGGAAVGAIGTRALPATLPGGLIAKRRLRLLLLCCLALATPVAAEPGFAPSALGTAPGSLLEVEESIATQQLLVRTEESRRARLRVGLDALGSARADSGSASFTRGRALYRIRRTGLLPVAGGFEAMLGHLSRVERLERLVQREIENVRATRDRQIALQRDIAPGPERDRRPRAPDALGEPAAHGRSSSSWPRC
ncbi:MAG: hypothetical protein IPH72_15930 [Sandaracinaceae bacterium]|nr:hypothetical protein [Sandaracinaceae bacterium]